MGCKLQFALKRRDATLFAWRQRREFPGFAWSCGACITWHVACEGGLTHKSPTTMKAFLNVCCALGLSSLLLFAAKNLEATAAPEVARSTTGSVAFDSYARTKIVQYLDTYRTDPMGLPPGWTVSIQVNEIPAAWCRSRIAAGLVVSASERTYLMAAPAELIRMMPTDSQHLRYYIAGCNMVAVDQKYKIVDSLNIPTIRLLGEGKLAQPLQFVRHLDSRL